MLSSTSPPRASSNETRRRCYFCVVSAPPPAAVAELTFEYGAHVVELSAEKPDAFELTERGRTVLWPRRDEFEAAARTALDEYGLHLVGWRIQVCRAESSTLRFPLPDERRWVRFLGMPFRSCARAAGGSRSSLVSVRVDRRGDWDAQIEESANHWFEFDLGITVGGKRVALLPIVIDALRELGVRSNQELAELNAETVYGRVREGAFVALPAARIAPLVAALVELFDEPLTREGARAHARAPLPDRPAGARDDRALDRGHAPARLGARARRRGGHGAGGDAANLRRHAARISAPRRRMAASAARFRLRRRPRRRYGPRQDRPTARARRDRTRRRTPESAGAGRRTDQRRPELARRDRALSPASAHASSLTGPDRAERYSEIDGADFVLTTYALLQRDAEELLEREWSLAVLDEAQFVKNPRSKGAQLARRLRAQQRIALTGTPVENHLDELWSIFAFAVPGFARRALGLHARLPHADRKTRRRPPARRARAAHASVPAAPHQRKRRRRSAAQERDRPPRRARRRAARSLRNDPPHHAPPRAAKKWAAAASSAAVSSCSTRCSNCARSAATRACSSCPASACPTVRPNSKRCSTCFPISSTTAGASCCSRSSPRCST